MICVVFVGLLIVVCGLRVDGGGVWRIGGSGV